MLKKQVTIESVILLLIIFTGLSFCFGTAFGARWVFKGVIHKPTYCYEDFEGLENKVNKVEITMDNGKVYYLYTDNESAN